MRSTALLFALPALLGAASPATREMSLQTPDGFTLKGTLTVPATRGRAPVVILAHQFGSQASAWAPLVEQLQQRGLATLAVDLRGHGASTRKKGQTAQIQYDFAASAKDLGFERIPEDLALAAAWVRRQPGVNGRRLGLAGASLGAFSAILAAPKLHPIAVLALSPAGGEAFGKDGRERLLDGLKAGHAATFLFASDRDGEAYGFAQAMKDTGGVCAKLMKGQEHGMDYLKGHADTMAVFFAEYLPKKHLAPR